MILNARRCLCPGRAGVDNAGDGASWLDRGERFVYPVRRGAAYLAVITSERARRGAGGQWDGEERRGRRGEEGGKAGWDAGIGPIPPPLYVFWRPCMYVHSG